MKYSAGSVWENRMTIHYVDTHAHILDESFEEDYDEMLKRTEEAHVDRIMIITLSKDEALKAIEVKRKNPKKFSIATGIFPCDVNEKDWDAFVQIAKDPMIDVIGEIGLDYHWEKDKGMQALQRELFIRQIELARQLNKPIAVHSREAIQDTFDIMKEHHWKGLMHCFPGTKEMAREFTKLGYYIALGGALTFKNARHSVEVCEDIDIKYLLSETDCPYMAPVPMRGKRNEPSYIPLIVRKMADVRNISVEEMANAIDENWTRFLCQ